MPRIINDDVLTEDDCNVIMDVCRFCFDELKEDGWYLDSQYQPEYERDDFCEDYPCEKCNRKLTEKDIG